MADGSFKTVYPKVGKISLDAAGIRALHSKITALSEQLGLSALPPEQMAVLAAQVSPARFERADIAQRFLTECPEYGDAKQWQELSETDAALGELIVLVDPIIALVEQALAGTLGELSQLTGRIERTADEMDKDPKAQGETSAFHVADVERARMEGTVAALRQRLEAHRAGGEEAAADAKIEAQRALGARRLKEGADPQRLLDKEPTVVRRKKEQE